MVTKYVELSTRIVRSDEMKTSLDFVSRLDASLLAAICIDLNFVTSIMIHSDSCGAKEIQKLEDAIRRGNKKVSLNDFLHKELGS